MTDTLLQRLVKIHKGHTGELCHKDHSSGSCACRGDLTLPSAISPLHCEKQLRYLQIKSLSFLTVSRSALNKRLNVDSALE